MTLTVDEREELAALRAYKLATEGKALDRAFARLESLLETPGFDPIVGIRAFRILSECLFCLREELGK